MFPDDERSDDTLPVTEPVGFHSQRRQTRGTFRRQAKLRPDEVVADRFVIIRFLGAGGMGEVYEAQDRFLQDTRVALKAILPGTVALEGSLARLEREVVLARQITHPNVCPVYDIVHSPDTPGFPCFIAMKLLRGETLAARLSGEKSLEIEEAVAILRQIADGLRAAHQANVLHRDLKPGNIMLEGSGASIKAVVTDFGLAHEYEPDMTAADERYLLGTPGYIAPELLNLCRATPASDLYSLGVVLHEMLSGKRPGRDPKSGRPVLSPVLTARHAPRFCVLLIEACLSADPHVRNKGFEQAIQNFYPDTKSLPAVYPTERSFSRRKVFSISGIAAAAVASGMYWKWDVIKNADHPLPKKRFVALMNWPPGTRPDAQPILSGVLDAIESVLTRVEAVDRDLFVVASRELFEDAASPTKLTQVRDQLGTNLVLGTTGLKEAGKFRLFLRIFDASTNALLRERMILCPLSQLANLPTQAVRAAGLLFNISLDDQQYKQVAQPPATQGAFEAYQTAEQLMKKPNFEGLNGAIQKYSEAANQDPRYALAYAKLAYAYCALYDLKHDPTDLELARNNGERALQLDNRLVLGHLALSTVFELNGDRRKALDEVAHALLIDPSNPNTLNWQATIYQRMNRWQDAEKTFKRMVSLRPNDWLAYNQLGWILSMQGKYAEAIGAFREASVTAPKQSLAFNNLGALYLKTGDLSKADESFRKSLQLKEDSDTLAGEAATLRAQGKMAEALVDARHAVELEPSNHWSWAELGDCYSSIRGEQRNAYEAYLRASSELERQLHVDDKDGPGWMRLALYRAKCNAHDAVLPLVSKAEKLGAADLDSQLAKVRILEIAGRRGEALTAAAAAMARGLTKFEIAYAPDLQSFRRDPAYLRMLGNSTNNSM